MTAEPTRADTTPGPNTLKPKVESTTKHNPAEPSSLPCPTEPNRALQQQHRHQQPADSRASPERQPAQQQSPAVQPCSANTWKSRESQRHPARAPNKWPVSCAARLAATRPSSRYSSAGHPGHETYASATLSWRSLLDLSICRSLCFPRA